MANEEILSIEEMVADIQTHYWKQLTEWEQRFIISLQDGINEGSQELFTDKQRAKLVQVYDRLDSL